MSMSASANPDDAVLQATDLVRNFAGLVAVGGVSLTLRPGQLHVVIGPNGAGKSTLVNLLSGDLVPTMGSILLAGRELAGEPSYRFAAAGIGRSYQRTNIFLSLSVTENVRLAAQARHGQGAAVWRSADRRGDLVAHADRAVERVGLARPERIANTLSHGEQRQLEIAMALATEPKVLLLDEPLAGMGPEESERMCDLLLSLKQDHGVLLIEHDMDVVFKVADWMTVMVDGKVLAVGTPDVIRANPDVQNAYLGGHA